VFDLGLRDQVIYSTGVSYACSS